MSIEHDAAPAGKIHRWANWEYADATARGAATGFVPGDVGKIAWQQDDDSFWLLTDDSPITWSQVAGTTPTAHASSHENGGSDEIDVTGLSGVLADPQVADKVKESSGPTTLTVGAVADGEFLKRSGSTVISGVPSGTGAESGANSDITSMDGLTGALQYITHADFTEGAAPSTPAANKVSLYAKSDGKVYIKDDAGTETDLTATGGAPTGSAGGDLSGTYPNPTVGQSSTAFALTGDISPSQLTGNTNDWNPTGLSTASVIRLSTDAARDITGLQGGADGRLMILHNIGSQNAVLKDESASSSAANRFALNADVTLGADQSALLQYDSTSSRWRLVAGPSAAGGGGSPGGSNTQVQFNDGGSFGGDAGLKYDKTNDQLLHALGTNTNPSVSFDGDPNTGIYSSAADTVDVATGGTKRWSINSSALTPGAHDTYNIGASGTRVNQTWANTSLALFFMIADDTDTGMSRNNMNELMFFTGGSGRWYISSSGHFFTNSDNSVDIGQDGGGGRPRSVYAGTKFKSPKFETTTSVHWTSGAGSPEGVVTANVGSLYTRTDGGAATTLYVKESGTGNTGWVAK